MELNLNGYLSSGTGNAKPGNILIKNNKIVGFKETQETDRIKQFTDAMFPIRRREFEVIFLNKHDAEYDVFQAFIMAKHNIEFGVYLTLIQKIKLKWMLKSYWIQKRNNTWGIFTLLFLILIAIFKML